jgi:hypothetical protein
MRRYFDARTRSLPELIHRRIGRQMTALPIGASNRAPRRRFPVSEYYAALFFSDSEWPLFGCVGARHRASRPQCRLAGADQFVRRYGRRNLPQAGPGYTVGNGASGRAPSAGFPNLPGGGFAGWVKTRRRQEAAAPLQTVLKSERRFSSKRRLVVYALSCPLQWRATSVAGAAAARTGPAFGFRLGR